MFVRFFSCCRKPVIEEEDEYLLADDGLDAHEETDEEQTIGLTTLGKLEEKLATIDNSLRILDDTPLIHHNLKTCLPSISTLVLMSGAIATLVLKGLDNAAKKGRVSLLLDQYNQISIPASGALNMTCGDVTFDYFANAPSRFCNNPGSLTLHHSLKMQRLLISQGSNAFWAVFNFCKAEIEILCRTEYNLARRDDLLAGFITTAGLVCLVGTGYLIIKNYYEFKDQMLIKDDTKRQFVMDTAKKFALNADWSTSLQTAKESFLAARLQLIQAIEDENRRLELMDALREAAQPAAMKSHISHARAIQASKGGVLNDAEDRARFRLWNAEAFTSSLHIIPNIVDYAVCQEKIDKEKQRTLTI